MYGPSFPVLDVIPASPLMLPAASPIISNCSGLCLNRNVIGTPMTPLHLASDDDSEVRRNSASVCLSVCLSVKIVPGQPCMSSPYRHFLCEILQLQIVPSYAFEDR